MKPECVLISCNLNMDYITCFPIVKKMWNELVGIRCVLVLIANEIPPELKMYENDIILFHPIEGINTASTAQCIRCLYPALLTDVENGILISDIDMVPMSKSYFFDSINKFDNNKFISYRNLMLHCRQISICYNIGTSKTYSEIFNIKTVDDIVNLLKKWFYGLDHDGKRGGKGWSTDQKKLFEYISKWDAATHNYIALSDDFTNFRRISRGDRQLSNIIKNNKKEIMEGVYSDFHMFMPFYKYEDENLNIISICQLIKN
jgi:hypothetical protein